MAVLLTVALGLAVVLLGTVAIGAVVGGFGALSGNELRRCERCHRFGLVAPDRVHPGGCPAPLFHRSAPSDRPLLGRRLAEGLGEGAHAPRHLS